MYYPRFYTKRREVGWTIRLRKLSRSSFEKSIIYPDYILNWTMMVQKMGRCGTPKERIENLLHVTQIVGTLEDGYVRKVPLPRVFP